MSDKLNNWTETKPAKAGWYWWKRETCQAGKFFEPFLIELTIAVRGEDEGELEAVCELGTFSSYELESGLWSREVCVPDDSVADEDDSPQKLTLPGFEKALLGKAERCGLGPVYVYSAAAVLNILMQRDSMDVDEALEYYEFNILGAYHGQGTPLFLDDMWGARWDMSGRFSGGI